MKYDQEEEYLKMRLYILRHGETASNAKAVMQGRLDEPLNENGRELARITGEAIKGLRFDACISSPLCRAMETAGILLRESGNDNEIIIDERLIEIDFGDCEGRKISEMGEEGLRFYKDPLHFPGFPNGESVRDVCKRTQEFLTELTAKDDGRTYLISTHGCAMRAMINHISPDPADYWLGHAPYNCSFTIVDAKGGKAHIVDIDRVYYDPSLIVDHYNKGQ